MEHVKEMIKTLNDFSLSVDATPLVLRQQRRDKPDYAPMQPRLLNDQTNLSLLSQKMLDNDMQNFESALNKSMEATGYPGEVLEEQPAANRSLQFSPHRTTAPSDWVENMRQAVHQWMVQQRLVIDCERAQISQQTESYAHALVQLQGKYDALQATHQDFVRHNEQMQEQFRQIVAYQQARIHQLEKGLKVKGDPQTRPLSPQNPECPTPHPQDPLFVTTTSEPLPSDHTKEKDCRTPRRRFRTLNEHGNPVVCYSNGAEKETLPDGTTIIRFVNGDVQTNNPNDKTSSYFFADSKVTKINCPNDGSTIYEFANGQVEHHFADGRKLVSCPNGEEFWVDADTDISGTSRLIGTSFNRIEDGDKYSVRD
jgi:hypothetical protein